MDPTPLLQAFFLLFIRFSSFFAAVPVLGAQTVPVQYKIALAAFLAGTTLAAAPVLVPQLGATGPGLNYQYLGLIVSEIALGLLLALVVTGFFTAFQLAGYLMGFQMGFTMANVVDPVNQDQVSVLGQVLFFLALLAFLAIDGHHLLIRGMVDSVRLVPPGSLALSGPSVLMLVQLMQGIFWAGMQFSLPVVGTLFVVDVGLGVIARTVPQMNVFMVGLPLKAGVGLLVMVLSFGATSAVMELYMADALADWMRLMPLLKG
ncbi:MAG TPA: flagellar biosynthetic protein FliR [bacterium]|nr:flagellar biosynthetic protein FliR [bacterium]